MLKTVGCQGYLDIEYLDKETEIVGPTSYKADCHIKTTTLPQWVYGDWGVSEEDYDVLEDY